MTTPGRYVCWWQSNPSHHLLITATDAKAAAKMFFDVMHDAVRTSNVVATQSDAGAIDVDVTWMTIKVGDRVSWRGSVNFGRDEVRWTGTVVSTQCGLPAAYECDVNGEMREIFPRHPAAMVHCDVPQHRLEEHDTVSAPILVRLDQLTLVESCSAARFAKLEDLVTIHERRAAICLCATCQRAVRR